MIHNTKIGPGHPFITARGAWNHFVAQRIYERLYSLKDNGIIRIDEIMRIKDYAKCAIPEGPFHSFLHLDLRPDNILLNNGCIYAIDAENAEWGDPYFELARFDVNNMLTDSFLEGYKSARKEKLDFTEISYKLYKLEVVALVLNVLFNEVNFDDALKDRFLDIFMRIKSEVI